MEDLLYSLLPLSKILLTYLLQVTCVVSIDYLTNPKAIAEEIGRVLRPGGEAIISISNR